MTLQNKQIAVADDEADERATGGASLHGAEFVLQGEKGADQVRKQRYAAIKYAATIHREVEDLVDMEEVVGEMRKKL